MPRSEDEVVAAGVSRSFPSALHIDMLTAPLQCVLPAALAPKSSLVAPSTAWARKVCVLRLIQLGVATSPANIVAKVAAGGIILDMRYMNSVVYNPDDQSATCGSGATWKDVICTTNAYGRSPRTLQSYAQPIAFL